MFSRIQRFGLDDKGGVGVLGVSTFPSLIQREMERCEWSEWGAVVA
jgi:hypothetical protein